MSERLIRRIKIRLVGLNVLLSLSNLGGIVLQRGVGRVDGRLISLDISLRRLKLLRRGSLRPLIRRDVLLSLSNLGGIVLQRGVGRVDGRLISLDISLRALFAAIVLFVSDC